MSATGGKTAYSWSITSGTLPAGLTLAASTGKISGTPTATGSRFITVQVKDANNAIISNVLTISVYALPTITTAALQAGVIGTAYNQTLIAANGKTAYTWSISSGTLPAGLVLVASTGIISGIPTTASTSSVTFKVTDANAKTATKALAITINATPPSITTTTLADGYTGVSYSQTLVAAGGKTPYTWSRTAGSLPAGLSLSSAGVISGTPTTAGTSNFTIQVKDGNNTTAAVPLTITVVPAVSVATTTLPSGIVGSTYNQLLTASGGKMPYFWSITSGTLPPGLILDTSTGAITGTPTAAGSTIFTAQVRDTNNKTASGAIAVTINMSVSITTSTLHDSFNGIAYSSFLSVIGGVPPYTWLISDGSLPAGLSLDASTGSISGTPNITGTSNFTVQVRDAGNAVSSKAYTVNITGFGSINGLVTDQSTGAPISGATVTLNLSGITSKSISDFIYTCNSLPIAANDYGKIADNDDVKLACTDRYYTGVKVRNPYGGTDPFTIRWNGLSAYSGGEYLAQSFKPTKSGMLNRVSFYFSGFSMMYGTQGAVSVLLKSSLGGDRGVYLATSAVKTLTLGTPTGWVDFDLTAPVSVTVGQDYFIELQGAFATWPFTSGTTYYDAALWGNGIQYPDGRSYQRSGAVWRQTGSSLAFRTYVDANPDITTTLPTQGIDMHGAASYEPNINLSNISNYEQERCYMDYSGKAESYSNNSDYTCTKTVTNGNSYYDQDGWINIHLYSQSSYGNYSQMDTTLLVTDQFSLTFNRTLTAVTDATGAYSFTDLPNGNYTLTMDKPAYTPTTSTGILAVGQVLNLTTPVVKAPPASLQGVIELSDSPGAGVTVTLTDPAGTHTTVSNINGNYRIDGIAYGNYNVTFSGPFLQTVTNTGTLTAGQTATLDVWMTGAPITLSIASPADGTLIPVVPLTVTGSAINAETVTIITTNNGMSDYYTAALANNVYTVAIPVVAGQTSIAVIADNKYYGHAAKSITVTRAPFTLSNIRDVGNVTVMELDGGYDAKNQDGSYNDQPRKAIAAQYFKNHGDADFMVFLSTFNYAMPETTAQGFYLPVKNDVQGINQPIMDNSGLFGSTGKLQGTIDLGNVTSLAGNPYGPKLDETLTVLNHELMHRYGAYVRFKNLDGTMDSSLLGKDSSHWSYLLDSKGSLMYGNGWKDNGDGTFTSIAKQSSYSPLDLYLMGMVPKEQVPSMLLIENASIDKTQLPHLGDTITGTAKTVTIDDIIAAEGERISNAATAQKQFNVGFVLLTRAGDNATAATQVIETLREAWAGRFAELTQGKGSVANIPVSLEIAVDTPVDGATIIGPDVTVSGTVINTSGAETGVIVNGIPATVDGSRFIVNHVPLQQGTNTIAIIATDANGLSTTANRSATTAAGHYLRITSNIGSGVAPLSISLRVDGSFSIVNPNVSAAGPVPSQLTVGASPTEYTAQLVAEGTYTFAASAVGPDGQTYSDNVTVTVQSKNQLDNLLKGKWDVMKGAMALKDVQKATSLFLDESKERYTGIFSALGDNMPQVSQEMQNIRMIYLRDRTAKYRIKKVEADGEITYYIYFAKDDNGLWKIQQF